MQRYYVYDTYWSRATDPNAPIFFYAGNEADVGLYVNATGLMWENAKAFGALMIFAEHRFYGASQPNGDSSSGSNSVKVQHPYLSHESVTSVYACGYTDGQRRTRTRFTLTNADVMTSLALARKGWLWQTMPS